jgi:hypothetical protein
MIAFPTKERGGALRAEVLGAGGNGTVRDVALTCNLIWQLRDNSFASLVQVFMSAE